jgi:hypothetical protein
VTADNGGSAAADGFRDGDVVDALTEISNVESDDGFRLS